MLAAMYPRHHGRTLLGGKLFGRSAHTGRMKATSNAARRDASAARVAQLFPDGPLGSFSSRRDAGSPVSDQTDVLQGTLDLLIMRTIALEPLHGWAIAQRIQQISDDLLRVQQGSLY